MTLAATVARSLSQALSKSLAAPGVGGGAAVERCFLFDGTNDYVSFPSAVRDLVDTAVDFSVALKIKYTGSPSQSTIFNCNPSGSRFAIEYNGSALRAGVKADPGTWANKNGGSLSADSEHEIIAAYDASPRGLTLWLDGVEITSTALTPTSTTVQVMDAGRLSNGILYWAGKIWDVRVWNSTLASAAAAASVTPTHRYLFDESSGATAADSIGSQDATINNAQPSFYTTVE